MRDAQRWLTWRVFFQCWKLYRHALGIYVCINTRKLICVNSVGYLCWTVTYLWKHARYSNVYVQPMYADMHVYSETQNQYFAWQHWINTCIIIFANQDSDFLILSQRWRCCMWTLYDKVLWGDISEYLPRGDTKVCHPRCRTCHATFLSPRDWNSGIVTFWHVCRHTFLACVHDLSCI